MLFALGNDHAGTYYPVVLAALPFLGAILREGGLAARLRTLDVLLDLRGSFEPEPFFELLPDGTRSLKALLQERMRTLADLVERRQAVAECPEEARLAGELLVLLRSGAD